MKTMVVYTSKYGSTEKYARWIGEALACPVKRLEEVRAEELAQCDRILYGGGVYVGNVSGLKKFLSRLDSARKQQLILFIVGMTHPAEKEAYAKIAQNSLPAEWRDRFQVFALRGDQLFSKMSGLHKLMMRMPKAAAEKKPEAERTEEDRRFIDSFGQDVCFASKDQLAPVLEHLSEA